MIQSFDKKRKTLTGKNAGWECYKVELDSGQFIEKPLARPVANSGIYFLHV